jgi:hypothetical protein
MRACLTRNPSLPPDPTSPPRVIRPRRAGVPGGIAAAALWVLLASILLPALAPSAARADWRATSTWMYQARNWGPRGLDSKVSNTPIRRARVEVRDAHSDSVLAWGLTDEHGRASILVPDTQVRDVYARAFAATGTADTSSDSISVSDGLDVLSVISPTLSSHRPNDDFEIPATALVRIGQGAEQFHILDCLLRGVDYAAWASGRRPHVSIRAVWPGSAITRPAETDSVTYALEVAGQRAWDELWLQSHANQAALWWLSHPTRRSRNTYRYTAPDWMSGTDGTWVGGWGVFAALATQRWLGTQNTGWHVALSPAKGVNAALKSVNMDQPGLSLQGATDTLAVARALWSLTGGSAGETVPTGSTTGAPAVEDTALWSAVLGIYSPEQELNSARAWIRLRNALPERTRSLDLAFRDAGFEYFPDAFEPDSCVSQATLIVPDAPATHHTLFHDPRLGATSAPPDTDWFQFQAEAGQGYLLEVRHPGDGNTASVEVFRDYVPGAGSSSALAYGSGSTASDPSTSVLFAPESGGTFVVRCRRATSAEFGHYDFAISRCGPAATFAALAPEALARFYPPEDLVWGGDGWFYGLSASSTWGDTTAGCFLRVDPKGVVQVLALYPKDLGTPSRLVLGEDGSLYGVSGAELSSDWPAPDSIVTSRATLFRVSRDGAWRFLRSFNRNLDIDGGPVAAPGSGVFLAVPRVQNGYSDTSYGSFILRADSLGGLSQLGWFPKASISGQLVPDASGGVYAAVLANDSTWNGLFHLSSSGDIQPFLRFPTNAYRACPVAGRDGSLYMMLETDSTRLLALPGPGRTRVLWGALRKEISRVGPRIFRGSDGRFYGTADNWLYGARRTSTFVADTLGNFAVLAGPTAFMASPGILAEGPDATLYGEDRYGRLYRVGGVVGRPLGGITQFALATAPGCVNLSWRPVIYATLHYQAERAEGEGDPFVPLASFTRTSADLLGWADSTALPGKAYRYRLAYRFGDAPWNYSAVLGTTARIPACLLGQPAPNPSRITCRMAFEVPSRGRVQIEVFNVAGARVRTLLDKVMDAGVGSVTWDGCDSRARLAPTGMYFARLNAAGRIATRKILRFR